LSVAIGAEITANPAPVDVREVAYDSRDVPGGSVFVCVPGERVDGHAFAEQAVARGAVALVAERQLDVDVPQLIVPDARRAMGLVADAVYGSPTRDVDVVGVTGTNGKTTTAFLLYAVLAAAGRRPGLLGTIERRIGGERRAAVRTTPESAELHRAFAEMRDVGDQSCAVEVSSHASALHRLVGVRFRALAFTNLTQDHLDFHRSMEAYYEAKRAPFLEVYDKGERPAAAVNADDGYGRRLARELREAGVAPLTYAMEAPADVRPSEAAIEPTGTRLLVDGLEIESRLRGRFNAENLLAALALGRLLELPDNAVKEGLEHVRGVPGRFEAVPHNGRFTVIVDYAHTPEAIATVLESARAICDGSLICVFGCGGERDPSKRAPMGERVSELADRVVVTSDNPRGERPEAIVEDILEGIDGVADVELDRKAAIEGALALARDGDVVVIAGKGHETGQEIDGEIKPFDDRAVAGDFLRARDEGQP
jgi:UDP-N-acetylmuramoyl-L-alanyl-D-glutamate--2,6-diaminopimelate ligase